MEPDIAGHVLAWKSLQQPWYSPASSPVWRRWTGGSSRQGLRLSASGSLFNTDQGGAVQPVRFTRMLQEQRVQVSMDGKGIGHRILGQHDHQCSAAVTAHMGRSIASTTPQVYLRLPLACRGPSWPGTDASLAFGQPAMQRPRQALGPDPASIPSQQSRIGWPGREEGSTSSHTRSRLRPSGMVKPSVGHGRLPSALALESFGGCRAKDYEGPPYHRLARAAGREDFSESLEEDY